MLTKAPHLLNDSELIFQIQAENSKPHFRMLVERHLQRLWRIAYNVLQDANEAEDVVQEVFVCVWDKRHDIDETKASFATWVYRITMNRAIDVKRKRKMATYDIQELSLSDVAPLADEQVSTQQTQQLLLSLLHELPEKQREALKQFYYEERSVREISKAMKSTEEATRALLKRGRQSLRHMIDRRYDEVQQKVALPMVAAL